MRNLLRAWPVGAGRAAGPRGSRIALVGALSLLPGAVLPGALLPGALLPGALLPGAIGVAPQPASSVLERYAIHPGAGLRHELPAVLQEVSGLAVSPEGKLFAHDDERGVVYEIDPGSGVVVKAFSLGPGGIPGDFEGIAAARGRLAMVTSAGQIMEFEEGEGGSTVDYHVHATGLGSFCEVEGLAYDPEEEEFLLPCKQSWAPDLRGHLVVMAVPLKSMRPYLVPRIFLPLEALREHGLDAAFHPSAIEVLPGSGTLVMASAVEEALLEVSAQGRVLGARKLSRRDHPQTEGLTFLPDGTMVLADEGQNGRGRLTLYRPTASPGGAHP